MRRGSNVFAYNGVYLAGKRPENLAGLAVPTVCGRKRAG